MKHNELRDIIAAFLRKITVINKVTVDEELDANNVSTIIVTHNDKILEISVIDPEL